MRDIKFRAYSTVTGDFDYVSMVQLLTSDNSKISSKMIKDDLSIMQFTGLQDVNGVDIYEGDILPFGAVVWHEDELAFCIENGGDMSLLSNVRFLLVIGNIHENPELLP